MLTRRHVLRLMLLGTVAAASSVACIQAEWTVVVPAPTPPFSFGEGDGRDGPFDEASGSFAVNTCYPVLLGTGNTVSLVDAGDLAPGDVVVFLGVQDSGFTPGDPSPITSPGNVGRWEIRGIASRTGDDLVLQSALTYSYRTSPTEGSSQGCRMPRYTDVHVRSGASIRAAEWDGSTGGVVAFFATGTVTLDSGATISAAGAGFRGGEPAPTGGPCGLIDLVSADGGSKGEGFDVSSRGLSGRGNLANGAGGGNSFEAGGGGGGGGGAGGLGGFEGECMPAEVETQGLGGSRLASQVVSRLTLGGGGGAGQEDGLDAGAGGDGGGIVLLLVRAFVGVGRIDVRGEAGGSSFDDGAGGGGGAGTVMVRALESTFQGNVVATGGSGGSLGIGGEVNGPGGGGGGGRVAGSGVSGVQIDVAGGINGVVVPAGSSARGATAGEQGIVEP